MHHLDIYSDLAYVLFGSVTLERRKLMGRLGNPPAVRLPKGEIRLSTYQEFTNTEFVFLRYSQLKRTSFKEPVHSKDAILALRTAGFEPAKIEHLNVYQRGSIERRFYPASLIVGLGSVGPLKDSQDGKIFVPVLSCTGAHLFGSSWLTELYPFDTVWDTDVSFLVYPL